MVGGPGEEMTPDDELVSAYLDGEATPDERARVEADPELLGRVEVLREVTRQTAMVPPPLDAVREANLVAALTIFDTEIAPRSAGATPPTVAPVGLAAPPVGVDRPGVVSDLDAARRRRQSRRMTVLGVAAAVILVVVVAAGLLLKGRTSTSTDVAATAAAPATNAPNAAAKADRSPVTGRAAEGGNSGAAGQAPTPPPTSAAPAARPTTTRANAGGAAAPAAPSASDSASATPFVGDLGPITPGPSFRSVVTSRLDQVDSDRGAGSPPSTSTPSSGVSSQLAACDAKLRGGDKELGRTVMTATATVNGTPALVIAYEVDPAITNANGAYRAYAVGTDCSILDNQTV